MDSLATFQPALQGWQTSDDYKLGIHVLRPPCSSSFVTLGCQQPAHEIQHHLVAFDYSLGFEEDCPDTPAFGTDRALPAMTVAADRGPSVHGTPAVPAPAFAAKTQRTSVPVTTTFATNLTGAHWAGTAAQQQPHNQQESQSAAPTNVSGNSAAQQQQHTQQEACHTASRSKELQISPASPRIKGETVTQPLQQQHSHSAAATSLAVHHQTEVQQVKEDKLKTTERCKVDTDRKLDQRLVHLKKGKAWLASGRPENSSSGVTSCTTPTVSGCSISGDLESRCAEQHKATWVASAEKTAAAAAAAADDDDNNVKLLSRSGYSQQCFWDYYIKIDVLDPEANPKMHLSLPTRRPDLQLNARNRRGKKAGKVGPLHALRKICRALRFALGPQAEEAWRSLGLRHKDSRGDYNLSGCYSFLESIPTGQRTCPYVQAANAKAAQWNDSNSMWGYLWPHEEELCVPGVVTYVARLVSWGLGRAIKPDELNTCFNNGGNGYKAIDQNLTKLGAYLWNWPLPLTNKADGLQLITADPPRRVLPANRAPKRTRTPSAAATAARGAAGCGGGSCDTSNKMQHSGRKRKTAAIDDDSDNDIDYQPPAAATARTKIKRNTAIGSRGHAT